MGNYISLSKVSVATDSAPASESAPVVSVNEECDNNDNFNVIVSSEQELKPELKPESIEKEIKNEEPTKLEEVKCEKSKVKTTFGDDIVFKKQILKKIDNKKNNKNNNKKNNNKKK